VTGIAIVNEIVSKNHGELMSIIKAHCDPGAVILSDQHSSYVCLRSGKSNLAKHGFYHFWVNHSNFYVHDKFQFVFTANIERTWCQIRRTQPALKAQRKSERTAEYLATYCLSQMVQRHKKYDWTLKVLREYYYDQHQKLALTYLWDEGQVPGLGKIDELRSNQVRSGGHKQTF
jgi:hypothetical protein